MCLRFIKLLPNGPIKPKCYALFWSSALIDMDRLMSYIEQEPTPQTEKEMEQSQSQKVANCIKNPCMSNRLWLAMFWGEQKI